MLGCSSRSWWNVSRWAWPRSALSVVHDVAEVLGVTPRQVVVLAGGNQLLGGVLAQGLQHPVAGGGPRSTTTMERSTSRPMVSSTSPASWLASATTASAAVRVHPPWKTESRLKTRCSRSVKQLVAPVDGRAQRLLPRLGGPRAGGEECEPLVQPAGDLDR